MTSLLLVEPCDPLGRTRRTTTHDTLLHVGRLSVKHVARLDTVLYHSDGSVEGPHEMRGDLSCVVHEHLPVLLSHSDQEPGTREERIVWSSAWSQEDALVGLERLKGVELTGRDCEAGPEREGDKG